MLRDTHIQNPFTADVTEQGLHYLLDEKPGITRRRCGRGWRYVSQNGKPIVAAAEIQRITTLRIPPAWSEVWISPDPDAHLQATGIDSRGRKQYRYHAQFREVTRQAKFAHLIDFARALPRIRRQVSSDLRKRTLCKKKVLASVVRLLETTLIRIGNDSYAKENGSYGLTTMCDHHATFDGTKIEFDFLGKSGKSHAIALRNKTLMRIAR